MQGKVDWAPKIIIPPLLPYKYYIMIILMSTEHIILLDYITKRLIMNFKDLRKITLYTGCVHISQNTCCRGYMSLRDSHDINRITNTTISKKF